MRGTFLRLRRYRQTVTAAVLMVLVLAGLPIIPAHASPITSPSDTLSTIKQSILANHTIQFITPSGIGITGVTLTITFPTGFTVGAFALLNEDINEFTGTPGSCSGSTSAKTLAASNGASTWGATSSGQVFTFTSPSSGAGSGITAGNCVQIIIGAGAATGGAGTNIITNQSAAQNAAAGGQTISIGGSMPDSGSLAVDIVTDNTVAVTATVIASISCSISANSIAFGTFVLDTVTTGGTSPIWTISSNGSHGYSLAVNDVGNGAGQAGLYNGSYTINSTTSDLNATAQGYGLQATATNGDAGSATSTVQSPFTASGTNVGILVTTLIPAAGTVVSSATGPVGHATVTSTLKAKINGIVPAGAYTDTLNYVCTGLY